MKWLGFVLFNALGTICTSLYEENAVLCYEAMVRSG